MYFDKALPKILLYRQEREQYDAASKPPFHKRYRASFKKGSR